MRKHRSSKTNPFLVESPQNDEKVAEAIEKHEAELDRNVLVGKLKLKNLAMAFVAEATDVTGYLIANDACWDLDAFIEQMKRLKKLAEDLQV